MKPDDTTKPCDAAEEMQTPAEPAAPAENGTPATEEMVLLVHTEEPPAETDEGAENMETSSSDDAQTDAETASDEAADPVEQTEDVAAEKPSSAEEEENIEALSSSADNPDNDTDTPAAPDTETSETKKAQSKKPVLLIVLLVIALVLCCVILVLLCLRKPHEPKKLQLTRNAAITAREMPTLPTDPPTEPPTEAPTEPPYEMKLDITKAQSYHTINEDVVGWVYIDDTVINYPVVQSDDNSYYMERNWQKQYSYSGSIFQDYACDLATTENTLLYGHNMGNGTMFHAIKNYKVEDWGLEHPYVEVSTLDTRYLYKVISVNVLYGDYGASFEYWNCKAMSSAAYSTFVQQIYDTSLVWYGGEELPEYGDEILTLQTCNSGAADGMRCVLFAVRVGEF